MYVTGRELIPKPLNCRILFGWLNFVSKYEKVNCQNHLSFHTLSVLMCPTSMKVMHLTTEANLNSGRKSMVIDAMVSAVCIYWEWVFVLIIFLYLSPLAYYYIVHFIWLLVWIPTLSLYNLFITLFLHCHFVSSQISPSKWFDWLLKIKDSVLAFSFHRCDPHVAQPRWKPSIPATATVVNSKSDVPFS
jgi:hypothetical protein